MKKLATVVFALAVVPVFVAGSDAARAAKGKATYVGAGDNPFFVTDPNDPRVLHPSDRALFQGLDGEYVERMAMPKIPAGVMQDLRARLGGGAAVTLRASDIPAPNPALAVSVEGNILVIEGDSSVPRTGGETYAVSTQNGIGFNHNSALFGAAEEVLARFGDNFDFITVFTTFDDPNVAAYYMPLKQDVEGLGDCNLNSGENLGCIFDQTGGLRLQGVVFMNSLNYWRQWDEFYDGVFNGHPLESFESAAYSTLGQEIAHRWGSGLRFVDPRTGNISKKLLGRDNSHWAAWVDTDASVMDGWDWDQTDDGVFDLVNDMDIYSTLDLYAMGALPVAAAEPFFFIDGARFTEEATGQFAFQVNGDPVPADAVLQLPGVFFQEANGIVLGATGERVDLTIQDIVDAEGNRCPDPDHTQKSFRQAVILVTRPDESISGAAIEAADLAIVNATWEAWWSERTAKALTLCTSLTEDCVHAQATLGGGQVTEADDRGFIERGTTATVTMEVGAVDGGAPVRNAKLVLSLEGNGAEHTTLEQTELDVGDLAPGEVKEVDVQVTFDAEYPCGLSVIVDAQLVSDNAQTANEEYRLFPGYGQVFLETFGQSDDFTVNQNGNDENTRGEFERVDVELSCDMTKRSPERDQTPANRGAYVTGKTTELDGDTTLWSPPIDLRGTAAPEVRYDFWLDGAPGDLLKVQVSRDGGDKFRTAVEEGESFHGWGLGRVEIKELFDGQVPDEIVVRFLFEGGGRLEGAIDNVRVVDPEGQCRAVLAGPCGCTVDGSASPQAAMAALLGLLALRIARRRR